MSARDIRADVDYDVRRQHGISGDIVSLACLRCDAEVRFVVFLRPLRKNGDRSGLPKYNRARAAMVRHFGEKHS